MFTIYVYVLDTLADWELGYVTAELHSRRFFKKGAPNISLKTVSCSKKPIQTMGGLTVVPDCLIEEIAVSGTSVLLLPGANTWNDPKHGAIIELSLIHICITRRRVQVLCNEGRIPGLTKFGKAWAIPRDAEKPADARKIKSVK